MAYVSLHDIVEEIDSVIEEVEDLVDVDSDDKTRVLNDLESLKAEVMARCNSGPGSSYQMYIAPPG